MGRKNYHDNPLVKIWNVIYPIFIYYVISNVAMYLFLFALQITEETYSQSYTMLQTIATALCLPVLFHFYRRDQLLCTVFQQRLQQGTAEIKQKRKILNCVLTFCGGALAGFALNQIISATGLIQVSEGYRQVTSHFYGGGILFEVLGVGILIPIAEELLYRGIVYGRLADWIGIPAAMAVSALIFGGLHMNLVQFLYAFLMGLLLVYFLETTRSLSGCICAHLGANLLTLFRVESGALSFLEAGPGAYWGATVAAAALAALLVLALYRCNRAEAQY